MAHRPTPAPRGNGPAATLDVDSSPAPPAPASLFAAHGCAAAPVARKTPPRQAVPASSVHTLETNGEPGSSRIVTTGGSWWRHTRPGAIGGHTWQFVKESAGRAYVTPEQNDWRPGDPEIPPANDVETSYRHGWWSEERGQVRAALARLGTAGRVLERWDNCGSDCWVRVNKKTGDVALSANTCRHRWCKPCGITRANLIGGNLAGELKRRRFQKFLHIVLTTKSTDHKLRDGKAHIFRAFRDLRRLRLGTVPKSKKMRGRVVNWWGQWVRGGAAFFETTLNTDASSPDCGRFHHHLHIIAQGRWVPIEDLRSLWASVSRDEKRGFPSSSVVWVERIESAEGAAAEVSKYAAKGIDSAIAADPNKLDELITGLRGSRLCFTFGTWRGFELTATPEFDPADWISLGRLDDLLRRAEAGDDRALHIFALLRGERRGLQLPPPPSAAFSHPN